MRTHTDVDTVVDTVVATHSILECELTHSINTSHNTAKHHAILILAQQHSQIQPISTAPFLMYAYSRGQVN